MKKVTPEDLDNLVAGANYIRIPDTTLVICVLELTSGFLIIGKSACLNREDFDEVVAQNIALKNAKEKLWELEGYHRSMMNV